LDFLNSILANPGLYVWGNGMKEARADGDAKLKSHLLQLEKSLPKAKQVDLEKPLSIVKRPWKNRLAIKLLLIAIFVSALFFLFPPFYWPANAPVSSGFLFRLAPDSRKLRLEIHHGIDIAAAKGSKVNSTAIGLVIEAGKNDELGNYVSVQHLLGFHSLYAHLQEIDVAKGSIVIPGVSVLGRVGSTGRATGPHLHFGLFFMNVPVPPGVALVFHSLRKRIIGI